MSDLEKNRSTSTKGSGSKAGRRTPSWRRLSFSTRRKRTPLKKVHTPVKRKIPRLKCGNVHCNVGFSSEKTRLFHQRFHCVFKAPTSSPSVSENNCRYCSQVFTLPRHRIRHERNVHSMSTTSSPANSKKSSSEDLTKSPTSSSGHSVRSVRTRASSISDDFNLNWVAPRTDSLNDIHDDGVNIINEAVASEDCSITLPTGWCNYCKTVIQRSDKLRQHVKDCYFKVPGHLEAYEIQPFKVRILKKCHDLASTCKLLSIENSYEYNEAVSACVPGVYPLVFPGPSHFGKHYPPILKLTAGYESITILYKILSFRKEITLKNHIILVEEDTKNEIYLGPRILIPDKSNLDIKYQDQNVTVLTLKSNSCCIDASSDDDTSGDMENANDESSDCLQCSEKDYDRNSGEFLYR